MTLLASYFPVESPKRADVGNVLSLYRGVHRELEPGALHAPPTLRRYGEMTVGVTECFVIAESGGRVLGSLPREMVVVPAP